MDQRSWLEPIARKEGGSEKVTGGIKPKDWSLVSGGGTGLTVQMLFQDQLWAPVQSGACGSGCLRDRAQHWEDGIADRQAGWFWSRTDPRLCQGRLCQARLCPSRLYDLGQLPLPLNAGFFICEIGAVLKSKGRNKLFKESVCM